MTIYTSIGEKHNALILSRNYSERG